MERMFVFEVLDGSVLVMAEGYLLNLDGGELLRRLIKHVCSLNASP